ncbi:FtsB family cell division protein [Dysosmobacter acutus]|uniref:FtsB family cell division protein n=1 Tax=Dysosmobacter acutus TaxID=2841504 RepID=UPI001F4CCA25|nr:septum formation initiator family protein [Dysosmobacter acutus]
MAARGKKQKKAGAGILTKLVILALLLAVGFQLYRLQGQITEAETNRAQLAAQVAAKQQENAALAKDIENGDDPETLEEIARNELGMVNPGEKVFYDVSN